MEYRIVPESKTGNEPIIGTNQTILDYWRWAHSDIASNSERGKLAEFIVKTAVGSDASFRTEWDAVDVISPNGIRIEVKSSAYLQSWNCKSLSKIQFDIAPKKSWDAETNTYYDTTGRNADVYVFCLFATKDPSIANPLNLSQWEFYILPTRILNEKVPLQKSIVLNSLLKLGAVQANYRSILRTIETVLL